MKYSKGYKYQLEDGKAFHTKFRPMADIVTDFITLTKSGLLVIKKGYAWDGPSGPTVDTPLFVLASLPHDALYQLMRLGLLYHADWRMADLELKRVVDVALGDLLDIPSLEMSSFTKKTIRVFWSVRIVYIMAGLKWAKGKAARPEQKRKIYEVDF